MEQPSRHVVFVLDGNARQRADIESAATSIRPGQGDGQATGRNARRDDNNESAPPPTRPAGSLAGGGETAPANEEAQLCVNEESTRKRDSSTRFLNKRPRWKKKGRSASIELELKRIEMHERLLLTGQQKMIEQLRAGADPHKPGQVFAPDHKQQPQQQRELEPDSRFAQIQTAAPAIECRNLSYRAGLGTFQRTILRGLSLTVPAGSIYGLLGPSGCGKTTLLRCVAGRLEPEAGSHIRVLGHRPSGGRVPGPAIGYMPQEVSVYEEFTIGETLAYFGRINRMRAGLLVARVDFLLKFLGLPAGKRLIKTLSGGQKRRVSLAVALVHSPPLLILDEPTVGVDPLLRQIIWDYLVRLASGERITIVITTHYIEEARQANIVGLMRDGRLLAESEPNELMRAFKLTRLEDVFLKLCLALDHHQAEQGESDGGDGYCKGDHDQDHDQEHGHEHDRLDLGAGLRQVALTGGDAPPNLAPGWPAARESQTVAAAAPSGPDLKRRTRFAHHSRVWLAILLAVTWKNFLRLRRNPPVLVFEFLLPALQVILFCLCIGGPPFDIPLAVVNEELAPQAGRLFLNALSPTTFVQRPYENLSAAIESVRAGQNWAAVHIPRGYTHHLHERLLHPAELELEALANATIAVYPDLSNLHLALAIEGAFKEAFVEFSRNSLQLLGYEPQLAELPIRLMEPVYGGPLAPAASEGHPTNQGRPTSATSSSSYLEFMAPGVVISITYVMATGLTALAFILEKRDGLLERSQIAGVSVVQILLGHALLQVFVMALQIGLVLVVTFGFFGVPSRGPFGLVAGLVLLQGCTGMAFGLLISSVCREENAAIMMLVGTFYINLILAGIMWPIEAMPRWLRPLSYAQPQTLPIIGLRDVLARGWSLEQASVQLAFATSIGWLLVFLLGAGLCMRHIK